MSNTQNIYLNDTLIGSMSAYTALPSVMCPSCGNKLHRLFNTQSEWKYVCEHESLLVDPNGSKDAQKVNIRA